MQLCNKKKFEEHLKNGLIKVEPKPNKTNKLFLDDIRVGLTLGDYIYEVEDTVDLKKLDKIKTIKHSLENFTLQPHKLYIGISKEKLSLPPNILGIINTRSKYSRIGIDFIKSSNVIIPGFGSKDPTPVVFEISSTIRILNFSNKIKYVYIIFLENNESIIINEKDYYDRFPFLQI